jgi:ATP-dependent Clp protease ATP-binding subunit ClpX
VIKLTKICSNCGNDISIKNKKIIHFSNMEDFCLCENCIEDAHNLISSNDSITSDDENLSILKDEKSFLEKYKPSKLKEYLDDYIIGQNDVKKKISIAVYNHYKRILNNKLNIDKSNILLLGPSGTGKTEIARTIAKILEVPFAIVDATTLPEAGYVGEDVENILLKLIKAADYDISAAENGIIYIDEIDKIAKKGENVSITRDVSGEGVQQALLKIIEGNDSVRVPIDGGRKHPNGQCLEINTKNILFIAAGAFDGIEMISNPSKKAGFNNKNDNCYKKCNTEDLIKYGMLREFIGRFPVISQTKQLTKEDLKKILIEPKNSIIDQYKELIELDGIIIEFTDDYLNYIVNCAIDNGTGARGLKNAIEETIEDIMFDAPDMEKNTILKITSNNVKDIINLKEA